MPELLGKLDGRIYIAAGEVAGLRDDNSRRYQAVQDYAAIVQKFPHVMFGLYIKEVMIPLFGVKNYWRRFEFDKSIGQIHFHMFAICADVQ